VPFDIATSMDGGFLSFGLAGRANGFLESKKTIALPDDTTSTRQISLEQGVTAIQLTDLNPVPAPDTSEQSSNLKQHTPVPQGSGSINISPSNSSLLTPSASSLPDAPTNVQGPNDGNLSFAALNAQVIALPINEIGNTSNFGFAGTISSALASGQNAIVLENQKQGTSRGVWQIEPGRDSDIIQGFTTAISTNLGGQVDFKINNQTSNPNYQINIYRLGYYGGDGATLVTSINHQAASAVVQPDPLRNSATGLVDAGNWQITDSWAIPTNATSGVYIANVIDGTEIFQIPFIVRDDGSHSDIVFQTDDQTWQAYNGWGGNNVYGGNGPGFEGAAYAVSYNRPITTRSGSTGTTGGGEFGTVNDMVFSAEYPAIYWLEQNGYDVSYISGLDASISGNLLLNHKVYMDVGHDEYWTNSQRTNVQAAADAGVNLVFLSGNEIYWQTRFEPSINGSPNRTLVTYKDTHANALIDPTGAATGTYMDPRFASGGGMSGLPSNALTGTLFQVDGPRTDTLTIPYDMSQLRFWRNTSVANTAPGQTASLVPNILGYEWDSSPDNGFRPAGLIAVSSTTLDVDDALLDYGNRIGNATATHNLVVYRNPVSGALVFGAGTVFWSWGLSAEHDSLIGPTPTDPNIQQATVNFLADMGVQPSTLQASLIIATQSTDHTAPTATVSQVSTTSIVEGGSVTVTGIASDIGGVIGGVEVSADGGTTWHFATTIVGRANTTWAYTFATGAPGTYQIQARAVDDNLNLGIASAGTAYSVTPSSNLTIFKPTDVPAVVTENDFHSVELGVKFKSASAGQITGIRFYKGPQNIGIHLGNLWTANGTLLATATFSNETASGWQQVTFSSPVFIAAGTTYIASYHTNTGGYSSTNFYFDNSGHTDGSLTAGGNGLNGFFAYGAGPLFPGNVSIVNGTNYWVDVVFNNTGQQQVQAANDSGFVVTENGSLAIVASALLANDVSPSSLPLSITGVSSGANGTVSYDSNSNTITFVPNAGYAGSAGFDYTISDTQGGTGTGHVVVAVNYPASAQSLFGTNDVPALVSTSDTNSVELGVKFTTAVNGTITGVRFYKGAQNTGPHIADLWSSTGTLLGTATFTNETASGWQQVNFSQAISVTAGTTYVASYHTSGHYSVDQNYFMSSLSNGALMAPGGNNGVYAYGTGSIFPTSAFNANNYWVDVVFSGVFLQPPVANNDSGFAVTSGQTLTIAASALLANDTDPNGLPLSITSVSNANHGSVTFNISTQTISFTPTAGYTGPAGFSYTISDGQAPIALANVSVSVAAIVTENLLANAVPSIVTVNDSSSVELGLKFTASENGNISGIRFYKGPLNTGPHVADLWSSTGTLLATATFTSETASGWQEVNFSSPVAIMAGTTYIASYHTNGNYSVTQNYFINPVVSGNLTALASGNGIYAYSTGSIFPTNTFNANNYWVDIIYSRSFSTPVASIPVARDDSGFIATKNAVLSISASTLLANDTDSSGSSIVLTGVNNASTGTVVFNAATNAVIFTPATDYSGTANFTYTISNASGGVASGQVTLLVNDPSLASLFNPTAAPSITTVNDRNSVEVGFKFQASTNGEITGLRFYKSLENTGPHVADIWSSTGTLLATTAFTNETVSGWQQVNFSSPVAVAAGTIYVASYHTNGAYSADPNYFAISHTNGSLTSPSSSASNGNGVFAYGSSSLFPNNSFNATSYGVDVLFRSQLAA
jgi:hypothetical protein